MGNEKGNKAFKLNGEALRLYKQIVTFVIDVKTIQGAIPLNSSKVVIRDTVISELVDCKLESAKNYWGKEETNTPFSDKTIETFNKNIEKFFKQIPALQTRLNGELKEAQIKPKEGGSSYIEIKKQLSKIDEFPLIKEAYENWKDIQFDINSSLKNIETCLSNFFQAIEKREVEGIWGFMSEDFKKRVSWDFTSEDLKRISWDNYSEKYQKIFEANTLPSTIGLDYITLLNQHKIELVAFCKINIGEPRSLKDITFKDRALKNIGEIGHRVQNILNQFKELATEEQKKMMQRVVLVFDTDGNEWYWNGFRLNNLDLAHVVLEPYQELVIRTFEFSFVRINDVWLVDNVIFQNEVPAPEEE